MIYFDENIIGDEVEAIIEQFDSLEGEKQLFLYGLYLRKWKMGNWNLMVKLYTQGI